MKTNRIQYENFILNCHQNIDRFVAGADADEFSRFNGLLNEYRENKNQTEDFKIKYFSELSKIKTYLKVAITIYRFNNYSNLSENNKIEKIEELLTELSECKGEDLFNIVEKGYTIFDFKQ